MIIQFCDHYQTDITCVFKEELISNILFVPITDTSDFVFILLTCDLVVHVTDSVGHNEEPGGNV